MSRQVIQTRFIDWIYQIKTPSYAVAWGRPVGSIDPGVKIRGAPRFTLGTLAKLRLRTRVKRLARIKGILTGTASHDRFGQKIGGVRYLLQGT